MKKLLLTIGTVLVAFTVQANNITTCTKLHEVATKIVGARYQGITLSTVLNLPGVDYSLRTIIIEAYGLPRMVVEENQEVQAKEFGNKVMLECLKDTGEEGEGV